MLSGQMLARFLSNTLDQRTTLRLYTAAEGSRVTEVSGGGYESHDLKLADWAITNDAIPALAEAPVREFRFDGTKSFNVIGSYLTAQDGAVLWVEPFDSGPIAVGRRGDIIPVRARMRMGAIS